MAVLPPAPQRTVALTTGLHQRDATDKCRDACPFTSETPSSIAGTPDFTALAVRQVNTWRLHRTDRQRHTHAAISSEGPSGGNLAVRIPVTQPAHPQGTPTSLNASSRQDLKGNSHRSFGALGHSVRPGQPNESRPKPAHLDILGGPVILSTPRMSTKAEEDRLELLQGTLDLLILRTLRLGPAHGHAIAKAIERGSDDVLQVRARLPVSGTSPLDQAEMDHLRGRHVGEQPARQVLSADRERPKATRGRNRSVGHAGRGHRPYPSSSGTGVNGR